MEVQGKIKMIGNTQTFGSNGFQKREVVVTTEEQYPQHILIEFVQDKCALLDQFRLGETISIGINLRGREWVNPEGETKYFNSIQGWKIHTVAQVAQASAEPFKSVDPSKVSDEDEDDLPF